MELDEFRVERNRLLAQCDYIVIRHRDQLELGETTYLPNAVYVEWLQYRSNLRNLTTGDDFPESPEPINPDVY
mgnify:FL=1